MTTMTIELPNRIAREAREAGLLAPETLTQLFKDSVRRQAGQAFAGNG